MPEQTKTSIADSSKVSAVNLSSGVRGTTPAGTSDEHSAAQAVRQMFDEIAPRYDFLNHVLSMNVDRLRGGARPALSATSFLVTMPAYLICALGPATCLWRCGAVASREKSSATILALDFSHQMLQHGLAKFNAKKIQPVEADALHLPLADSSVDLVVSSFGFRNLATIMVQVCVRSSASSNRKVKSAYWISASPAACWANFMGSISAKYCQRSEQ